MLLNRIEKHAMNNPVRAFFQRTLSRNVTMVRLFGFCTLLLISGLVSAQELEDPTLYYNGVVFTGQTDQPDAAWFVVDEGVFIAVGTEPGIVSEWSDIPSIDLEGQFVAPGFIDAHLHFVDGGLSLMQTDLANVETVDQLTQQMEQARAEPIGEWVMARNMSPGALGSELPNHNNMAEAMGAEPTIVTLMGGHHAYINPAGLEILGIHEDTEDPAHGAIGRDAQGRPTGLLTDTAWWNAQQQVYTSLDPETIAQATLLAQRRAVRYGITAIGDNTFYPDHAAQYMRMADDGVFVLRVSLRSWGKVPVTEFLMRNFDNDQIQYFGAKYLVDQGLSWAGTLQAGPEPGGTPTYTVDELTEIFLFAGESSTAYHTQGAEGLERLLTAYLAAEDRRPEGVVDVIDHCGSCSGDFISRIAEAGLLITLLPGMYHELPMLADIYEPAVFDGLLRFRELFDSGLRPALSSDWPFGTAVTYPELDDSFHHLGLSPLASVAVVVSGATPAGETIAHTDQRTISMSQALLGVTRNAAIAIGREEDSGLIETGYLADFIVLRESPFDVEPTSLYQMPIEATYVAGSLVFDHSEPTAGIGVFSPEQTAREYDSHPMSWTPSPIVGYDPALGFILGGALFVNPFRSDGVYANLIVNTAPQQSFTMFAEGSVQWGITPELSPRLSFELDQFSEAYCGSGMATRADHSIDTIPFEIDVQPGLLYHLTDEIDLTFDGLYSYRADEAVEQIEAMGSLGEGPIEGHAAGAGFAILHNTRDTLFSPRRGGMREVWLDSWLLQGNELSLLGRMGARVSQFIPLYAPSLILALRAEAGLSIGEHSYTTNFAIGGDEILRGYYDNRFRGHYYAALGTELRFPIWFFISGVAFAETGMVFLDDVEPQWEDVAVVGGGGLRFGLPPDFLIKLRFDVGFGRDQWGLFFAFDEAF